MKFIEAIVGSSQSPPLRDLKEEENHPQQPSSQSLSGEQHPSSLLRSSSSLLRVPPPPPPVVFNTLLELYLSEPHVNHDKALSLLRDRAGFYDEQLSLTICQRFGFIPGLIYLYERLKLYEEILRLYSERGDWQEVLRTCHDYGDRDPSLWLKALDVFTNQSTANQELLEKVLETIESRHLAPPLTVLRTLSIPSKKLPLASVKACLRRWVKLANEQAEEEHSEVEKIREEITSVKAEVDRLQTTAEIFQITQCSACLNPLELPALYIACGHGYHLRCLNDATPDGTRDCIVCAPANRKLVRQYEQRQLSRPSLLRNGRTAVYQES